MGLIESASGQSIWRGMDYYKDKKVSSWVKNADGSFDGVVKGSEKNKYAVHIDNSHPRKSSCNCAFADGRRVICKHMIALYFTAEPKAADDFMKKVELWEKEEEENEKKRLDDLMKYVKGLSKAELQKQLYDALLELEELRYRY